MVEKPRGKSDAVLWVLVGLSAVFTLFLIYDGITSYRTMLPDFLFTLVPQWFVGRFVKSLPRRIELALVVSLPGAAMGSCFLTGIVAVWRYGSAGRAGCRALYWRVAIVAACAIILNGFCIFSLWRAYFAAF
jgi:hypothetical protein